MLYKDNRIMKSLCHYLGPLTEHMVCESELVRLLLALHLLLQLTCLLLPSVIIGLDNQAAICLLMNQDSKPAHYLLNTIHDATKRLHQHQDRLQHKDLFRQDWQWNQQRIAKSNGIVDLQIHWIPGHLDFALNDKANKLAKEAATGNSSPPKDLPTLLRKPLPASLSALCQELKAKIQWRWTRHCHHMGGIDKSIPSNIGLNKHLHQIKCSESPHCPNCNKNTIETVHHFPFDCTQYHHERSILHRKLHCHTHNLPHLLTHPTATLPLLKYIHATGCLKQTFGAIYPDEQAMANTT